MEEHNESYCLAILITNLKNRKRYPDPITVADCAKSLFDTHGSYETVAKMVGVHASVIRKWVKLSNAPANLPQYVKEGKIYPVAAFSILAAFPEDEIRAAIAEEVVGWGEPEILRLIKYMKNNRNLSPAECRELVIAEALGEMINNDQRSS